MNLSLPKVDLHIHSYYSDGKLPCSRIVETAIREDMKVIALTDHDTQKGIAKMKQLVADTGLVFIPGIEVSTNFKGKEYHLLGYGEFEEDVQFQSMLAHNNLIKKQNDRVFIQRLSQLFEDLSVEDYDHYTVDKSRSGWKSLNYLKDNGYIQTRGQFFDLFHAFCETSDYVSPMDVIPLIHRNGGTTILAHPTNYQPGDRMPQSDMDNWVNLGLDGFEVYNSYYTEDSARDYYLDYCRAHKLCITGGSDFHANERKPKLGYPEVFLDQLLLPQLNSVKEVLALMK